MAHPSLSSSWKKEEPILPWEKQLETPPYGTLWCQSKKTEGYLPVLKHLRGIHLWGWKRPPTPKTTSCPMSLVTSQLESQPPPLGSLLIL